MTACLLILHYVRNELSYDNFNAKGDRLYRINQDRYTHGKLSTQWAAGASAAVPVFKETFPEIEEFVKLLNIGQQLVSYKDQKLVLKKEILNVSFHVCLGKQLGIIGDNISLSKIKY